MSLSEDQAPSFLGPLEGKTATFLLGGRDANLGFARTVMHALATARLPCVILDLDAFYSTNADLIFRKLPGDLTSFEPRVPAPGVDIEAEFSSMFRAEPRAIVVDSLNSLYHLLSQEDGRSSGRKILFALEALSQFARANTKPVILSMYKREGLAKQARGRSIATLTDVTASAESDGYRLRILTEKGTAWPGGSASIRIP